jgi:hypothetical protein
VYDNVGGYMAHSAADTSDADFTINWGTQFCGTISSDTTWSGAVYVPCDVTVDSGAELTLSPGCVVHFATSDSSHGGASSSKCELIVEGELTAEGTSQSPVLLTSASSAPSIYDWYGVRILSGSAIFEPEYCNFEYASFPISSGDTIHVDNCSFSHFVGPGIYAGSRVTVEDCYVEMSSCIFGIEVLANATGTLTGNTIVGNGAGYGVVCCPHSSVTLSYNVISGVGSGIYADSATVNMSHNKVSGFNQYGMHSLSSALTLQQDTMLVGSTGVCGMELESGTTGTISYAYITGSGVINTYGIETKGDISPTIEHSIISGTDMGIQCCDGSAPAISRDSIAADCGIRCTDTASPIIRYTTISGIGGATGVAVLDEADPNIGVSGNDGNNRFCPSTGFSYYVASMTQSTIMAEKNWWGASKPNSSKFIGSVDYNPYLGSDPGPGYALPLLPLVTGLPKAPFVTQCYPNPSNPQTTIEYGVSEPASRVKVAIYDVSGRAVRLLVDEVKGAGYHKAVWDGKNEGGEGVASGVYFYEVMIGDFRQTKKLVVLR